jgi:hypothetical protein
MTSLTLAEPPVSYSYKDFCELRAGHTPIVAGSPRKWSKKTEHGIAASFYGINQQRIRDGPGGLRRAQGREGAVVQAEGHEN